MRQAASTARLGLLSLSLFVAHAGFYLHRGTPQEVCWSCNVAPLLLAFGGMTGKSYPCAVAVCWLAFGTPLWAFDLAMGSVFFPTSALTHVGGLAVGWRTLQRLGWPIGAWRVAVVAGLGWLVVTRLVTLPEHNVNLVFSVYPGWEWAPHAVYLGGLVAMSALVFFLVERAALRFGKT